ncbi:hypothetical protein V9T40_004354 [Parthenolecanium corni]|uniref:SAP30-binding protein n=1 Tax=Parthenolecanium corni TaxID=536013 RepID=A0AAN9TW91_9HEMI
MMSASKALQSLTACYTDSENEDDDIKDETSMDIESDSESKEVEEVDEDLPPEPSGKCSPEMEEKIKNFFSKIEAGQDLNKKLQNNKAFRNPSIYEKLIEFCNVNELGTNYPPHIYDPFRWGKESFYDELAKVQKAEMDKREKEKKEKTKVEIVSGTAKKSTATNGNSNVSIAVEGEKRRKTKWDQVESGSNIR